MQKIAFITPRDRTFADPPIQDDINRLIAKEKENGFTVKTIQHSTSNTELGGSMVTSQHFTILFEKPDE